MNIKNELSLLILCFFSFNTVGQTNVIPIVTDCYNLNYVENTDRWALFWDNNNYSQTLLLSEGNSANYQLGSTTINHISESGSSSNRIQILTSSQVQNELSAIGYSMPSLDNEYFLRLGGHLAPNLGSEEVVRKVNLTLENSHIQTACRVVLKFAENEDGDYINPQYFRVAAKVQYDDGTIADLPAEIESLIINPYSPLLEYDLELANDYYFYQRDYDVNFAHYVDMCRNPVLTLSFMVSDPESPINYLNHGEAYAYITSDCNIDHAAFIDFDDKICTNYNYTLLEPNLGVNNQNSNSVITWLVKGIANGVMEVLQQGDNDYTFTIPGDYVIIYTVTNPNFADCELEIEYYFNVSNCENTSECDDCSSFNLENDKKYVISAWVNVMQDIGDNYVKVNSIMNYDEAYLDLIFLDVSGNAIGSPLTFHASGEIIDGWQRILGEFVTPSNAYDMSFDLVNNYDGLSVFFDDIRVHPFNGNLKSFVYDQETQKLMAELDESNYATFYEYDKEGGLVRVKKETEKGVFTIQETRSSTIKKD